MNASDYLLTVFTPAYNRAHTLPRVYESLLRQHDTSSFEWLVVDDGSTDGTEQLIQQYISENKIAIHYIFKQNGGKHTATNVGITNAKGEYFLCLDSDDFLADDAIEKIEKCVETYSPDGIIAYKEILNVTKVSGSPFPEELVFASAYALANKYCCGGERTLVYKTNLIRDIHTPEPPGQKFFPENYLSDRFDEQYESVLLPESLCICEYQQGGYSDSFRRLMYSNPISMKWFFAERLDMAYSFKQRYNEAYHYVGYKLLARSKLGEYHGHHKGTVLLSVPLGGFFYLFYIFCKLRDSFRIHEIRGES